MSAELLSAVAGGVLSLIMSYVPGVKTWWDGLTGQYRRTVMGVLILAAAGGAYWGACAGYWQGECGNWQMYLQMALAALVTNQSVYKITKG